jgi:hypothetical protein
MGYSHSLAKKEPERLAGEYPETANTQTTTICLGKHLVIHVSTPATLAAALGGWLATRPALAAVPAHLLH